MCLCHCSVLESRTPLNAHEKVKYILCVRKKIESCWLTPPYCILLLTEHSTYINLYINLRKLYQLISLCNKISTNKTYDCLVLIYSQIDQEKWRRFIRHLLPGGQHRKKQFLLVGHWITDFEMWVRPRTFYHSLVDMIIRILINSFLWHHHECFMQENNYYFIRNRLYSPNLIFIRRKSKLSMQS